MIKKLASGKIVCLFGTGDIMISTGKDEGFEFDPSSIVFSQHDKPMPIDVPHPEFIGKRVVDWAIKMYFDRPESLNALIHVLQDFKKERFPEPTGEIEGQ